AVVLTRRVRVGPFIGLEQDACRRAIEIVILAALQTPHEGRQSGQAHADGNRNKKEEVDHPTGPWLGGTRLESKTASFELPVSARPGPASSVQQRIDQLHLENRGDGVRRLSVA